MTRSFAREASKLSPVLDRSELNDCPSRTVTLDPAGIVIALADIINPIVRIRIVATERTTFFELMDK
jgi:hypothetical protein